MHIRAGIETKERQIKFTNDLILIKSTFCHLQFADDAGCDDILQAQSCISYKYNYYYYYYVMHIYMGSMNDKVSLINTKCDAEHY